jgi:hypothetical protein
MEQHIGLGHGARITDIDIWWPASNTRQHFTNVPKDQYIQVNELANDYTKLERRTPKGGSSSGSAASR